MKANKMAINWFIDFDKEEKWINDMAKSGWALQIGRASCRERV